MQKKSRSNTNENSMEAWPVSRRFSRVKALEEGVISIGGRCTGHNSESSDNTDTTVTTTTSILPSQALKWVSI